MLDFVMVVPTLNEEVYIGEIVSSADALLGRMFRHYRIVVVDESSTDRTVQIVRQLMRRHKSLRLIDRRTPGNRGLDARYGMSKFDARLYFYIDADLKPSLPYLRELVKKGREGYDVVTGSRYVDEGLVRRPPLRTAVSKCYNLLLNILFGEDIKDHQCGFKLFSRRAFVHINRQSEENHWMWDVEIFLIAQCNRLSICEVPIVYIERKSKRTPILRLLKDIRIHSPGIARLYYRYRIRKECS
jgi:glycosyltransferase AglD